MILRTLTCTQCAMILCIAVVRFFIDLHLRNWGRLWDAHTLCWQKWKFPIKNVSLYFSRIFLEAPTRGFRAEFRALSSNDSGIFFFFFEPAKFFEFHFPKLIDYFHFGAWIHKLVCWTIFWQIKFCFSSFTLVWIINWNVCAVIFPWSILYQRCINSLIFCSISKIQQRWRKWWLSLLEFLSFLLQRNWFS